MHDCANVLKHVHGSATNEDPNKDPSNLLHKRKDVQKTMRPAEASSYEVQGKKKNGQVCCPTSHVCDGRAICEAHRCNYKLRGSKAQSVTGNACDNE
jgi:hypothetical protein